MTLGGIRQDLAKILRDGKRAEMVICYLLDSGLVAFDREMNVAPTKEGQK